MKTNRCRNEDDCPTPMWCRSKDKCPRAKETRKIGWLARLVRRLSAWALRDELRLQQNVNEDAQALVDAVLRGERPDAYCGYGRDGQASNYRDELKWSLHELKKLNA